MREGNIHVVMSAVDFSMKKITHCNTSDQCFSQDVINVERVSRFHIAAFA